MSDDYRLLVRAGLTPLVEQVPLGPEWADFDTTTTSTHAVVPRLPGWVLGVGAAAVVLTVLGVSALLLAGEAPPTATTLQSATTASTANGGPNVFVPPTRTVDGLTYLDLTLLDGSHLSLAYPADLDLTSRGVEAQATGGMGAPNRTIVTRYGPPTDFLSEAEANQGPGQLTNTYSRPDGSQVQRWDFPDTPYLVFDFSPWTAYVWDTKTEVDEVVQAWALNLRGSTDSNGYLVLNADPPLELLDASDSPGMDGPDIRVDGASGSLLVFINDCDRMTGLDDETYGNDVFAFCDAATNTLLFVGGDAEVQQQVHETLQVNPPPTPTTSVTTPSPTEPLHLDGGVSVINLAMEDRSRFAVLLPTDLAGSSVAMSEDVVGAIIEGEEFSATMIYKYCPSGAEEAGGLNRRGAVVSQTDSGIVVCRPDQFLVLEIDTELSLPAASREAFDIVPIEIGPQYASRTFGNMNGNCCDDFGPLTVGDLVVTANRFTSGLITAWDAETLVPRWTTDLGVSSLGDPASLLLGVAGDLVLVTPGVDRVVALDAASGEIQWEVSIQGKTVGAAEDPDGRVWYVTTDFSSEGFTEPPQVTAIDVDSGVVVWTTEAEPRTTWQWDDPAVFPGIVVVMDVPGYRQEGEPAETARLLAIDARNGAALWTTELDSPSEAFSDDLLIEDVERQILIAATPEGSVFRVDPETGEVLWRADIGFVRLLRIEDNTVVLYGPNTVPTYLDLETGEQAE